MSLNIPCLESEFILFGLLVRTFLPVSYRLNSRVPRPLKLSHIRDLPDNVAKHVKPLVPVPPIYRYEEVDAYSSCKIRSAGEESRSRKSNTRPVVSSYHRSASSPIPQSYSNSNYTEFMASGISTQRNTGGRRRKRGGRGRNRRGRRRGITRLIVLQIKRISYCRNF